MSNVCPAGHKNRRRTVAKYREGMGIPTSDKGNA
ncbi:MAG: hypothetical protein ACLSE6_05165 [Alphaproteobacteria bacterium]